MQIACITAKETNKNKQQYTKFKIPTNQDTKFIKKKSLSISKYLYTFKRVSTPILRNLFTNQRLPGACNRSPGSKLLSITTQLHCGGHLGRKAQLPDTILEEDHPMTIPSKFGSNCATGSRQDGFYVNFPQGSMLN